MWTLLVNKECTHAVFFFFLCCRCFCDCGNDAFYKNVIRLIVENGNPFPNSEAYPLTTAFTDCQRRIHLVKDDAEWIVDSVEDLGIPPGIKPPVNSLMDFGIPHRIDPPVDLVEDPNIQRLGDDAASLSEKRVLKRTSVGESVPFICIDTKADHKKILILSGKRS